LIKKGLIASITSLACIKNGREEATTKTKGFDLRTQLQKVLIK
jgi:hypothetical protein